MTQRASIRWAALAAAAAVGLAGCAGGAPDSGGGQDAVPETSEETTAEAAPGKASSGQADSRADSQGDQSPAEDATAEDPAAQHIARAAGLDLLVKDLDEGVDRVRAVAKDSGGQISSEQTNIDPDGDWSRTRIVVTVPVEELDRALAQLEEVGEVTRRTSETEDLTSSYTDTDARIRTMKKSISRLEELMDGAEDLDQIITLEDELAEREADLESLTRRMKALEKQTTTAPITLTLRTEDAEDEEDETGFVAGLHDGWAAFTASAGAAVTALGAALPFVLVGGLLLTPLLWWRRRRRARVSAS